MAEIKKTTATEKLESFLFSLQLVCVVINVFSAIWQFNAITSAIMAVSFILTAGLAFITIANKNNRYTVLLWIFIALLSYLSVSNGDMVTSFEYLKQWIMFMTTINLYFWVYSAKINDKMIKRIFVCGIVTAIIFITAFIAGRTYANPRLPTMATFGLSNPNLTGIYILNVFLCIFILTKFINNKFWRFICYIVCCMLFYFIWLTEARSCIIAAIACVLLSFLPNKKYSKLLTFSILIFPLVFVFMYLELINTDIANIFEFINSDGKSLTSRVRIWEEAIYIIRSDLLFGNYLYGSGNRHNTHLMILAAFGFFTFTLVIIYLNRVVNYIGTYIREKNQLISLYAFYAVILMGTFEAVLFSGSQGMYVFSGAFLMIAKYLKKESTEVS